MQNFYGGNFDGYWLFKYLTENILTNGHYLHHTPVNAVFVFKECDRLNFDSLAGKHQKHQNFSLSKFCAIYTVYNITLIVQSPICGDCFIRGYCIVGILRRKIFTNFANPKMLVY